MTKQQQIDKLASMVTAQAATIKEQDDKLALARKLYVEQRLEIERLRAPKAKFAVGPRLAAAREAAMASGKTTLA